MAHKLNVGVNESSSPGSEENNVEILLGKSGFVMTLL